MRLALVLLLGLLVMPGSPAIAADEKPAAGPASVSLQGRGYGHGHGMSQWAAQGAASQHGVGYRRILGFYYPGTTWGTARGRIAALITGDTTADVVVRPRSGLVARTPGGDARRLDDDNARGWRLRPADGALRLEKLAARWRLVATMPVGSDFFAGGKPIGLVTPAGTVRYRGALRAAKAGAGIDTVNVLPLEQYLRGVVPQEVPALWHPHAVRAQAVAARTYAAFERRSRTGYFDVYDTTASQVYGGASAEHPAADDAIRTTARQVLTKDGNPIFSQFSASNGGWTSYGGYSYLPAKQDPWDSWSGNPYRLWSASIRAAAIERAFPSIGDFQRLRILRRDGNGAWNGRVLRIRIVGARDTTAVSGDTFRSIFGLRSTWFRLT